MPKFVIIGLVVLVTVGIIASVIVVGKTLLSNAATPAPTNTQPVIRIPPPTPDNIASPTAITNATSTSQISTADLINQAANNNGGTTSSLTSSGWKVVGSGDVSVSPQFSVDGKSIDVDFQSNNFSKITDISYSLSYVADPQVTKFIKGDFSPAGEASPIRKTIVLGTCSGLNCVYDTNPRGFTLKVLVKTNGGLSVYLITLTITANAASVVP